MRDILTHKWLRIPYLLHFHYEQRVRSPRATIILLHGIGASSKMWHAVAQRLPQDVNIITIDLLGFGASPQPAWVTYNAQRQARSVLYSCRKKRLKGPVILVGHSMGALVAVEIAKLQPAFTRSLILCSPPFYTTQGSRRTLASSQNILRSLYARIQAHPEQFVKISRIAAKYNLINRAFQVDEANVSTYMNALEASIVNQTAFDDIQQLTIPITLLYGTLDAVVIFKHLRYLARHKENIDLKTVVAGHEIKGPYVSAIVRSIEKTLRPQDVLSIK